MAGNPSHVCAMLHVHWLRMRLRRLCPDMWVPPCTSTGCLLEDGMTYPSCPCNCNVTPSLTADEEGYLAIIILTNSS